MSEFSVSIVCNEEQETAQLATKLAQSLATLGIGGLTIYLEGDLGAGKTTFSRSFLQELGHKGSVKSPTYTLVEPYEINDINVFHFDLYRLADPEELEFMGIRDYFHAKSMCLIEWPDKGFGLLPAADLKMQISFDGSDRVFKLSTSERKVEACLNVLPN
jgi:tRNA threonylcarbamoyladenosine biosynthesis protein TsaE